MSTIIMRSALVARGRTPPPDLARVVIDHYGATPRIVTWADVLAARRERQAEILARKRHVDEWRAVKVWVAYFDMDLMGGWQAFIERHPRGGCWWNQSTWIDRDGVFHRFPKPPEPPPKSAPSTAHNGTCDRVVELVEAHPGLDMEGVLAHQFGSDAIPLFKKMLAFRGHLFALARAGKVDNHDGRYYRAQGGAK